MKRFLLVVAVACLSFVFTQNVQAEEAAPAGASAVAVDSSLFVDSEALASAKGADALAKALGEDAAPGSDAKCWFWTWRNWGYYYPCYYYYYWYCPVYYVRVRLVTYTVPVATTVVSTTPVVTTPVVTTPAVTTPVATTPVATAPSTTTIATATATATTISKSNGQVARGAIIDETVPAHSPLYKMGLRSGDIIASVDGQPITSIADIRRVKADSNITYVRGNQIRVAGRSVLQNANGTNTKSMAGASQTDFDTTLLKAAKGKTISLYDYYDSVNKSNSEEEYGAHQY